MHLTFSQDRGASVLGNSQVKMFAMSGLSEARVELQLAPFV